MAALEARLSGSTPEGTSAAPEQEVIEPAGVETGIISNNCSLEYTGTEVTKTYDDHDCVVLYFNFTNGSGETSSAGDEFKVKVFQNGKEQDTGVISSADGNQPAQEWHTEMRSGSAPLPVGYVAEIGDLSDIIVSLSSRSDYNMDPIEFSVTLN